MMRAILKGPYCLKITGAILLAVGCFAVRSRAEAPETPPGPSPAPAQSHFGIPREPGDVDPEDPESSLPLFDAYCWECFLAINTQAVEGRRGEIAKTPALAAPGDRAVWMTWRSRDDLYPADCGTPKAWDEADGGPAPEDSQALPLSHISKITTSLLDLDVNQPGADANVFIGPLIDQNGRFTRFEIRYNRVAYQHLYDKKLWDWHYLPNMGELPAEFPHGSVVVKAAWRVIGEGEDDFKKRCFWTTARLIDPFHPEVVLKEATVGLVGLHVVHRTPKRRQWIWSSFEHVDNVPEGPTPEPGKHYSFNYGSAYTGSPPPNLDSNGPAGAVDRIPVAVTSLDGDGHLRPTHVTRVQPVHPKTEATNRRYQERLAGTVWQYYKLVVTQFPTQPDRDDTDLPGDPYPRAGGVVAGEPGVVNVANTAMETYVQTKTSCMECHLRAKHYGVSFMFSPGRALLCQVRPHGEARQAAASEKLATELKEARARLRAFDRKVLPELYQSIAPKPPGEPEANPADPSRKAGASVSPCDSDAERIEVAVNVPTAEEQAEEDKFKPVRNIFLVAIGRWREKNGGTCNPDMLKRHGVLFGWKNNEPWRTWADLKAARFAPPGMKPEEWAPLVDDRARIVRDMLLIRVLRGEGVQQARGKRMPLGGPYLDEDQIETIERFIAERTNKPIS